MNETYYVCNMKQAVFDLKGFSKEIKGYRELMKVSLRTAAKQLGIHPSILCRIEQRIPTSINNVLTICEWMNVPINKFYKIKTVKNGKQS